MQGLLGKVGQDEAGLVDLSAVVAALVFLLLGRPGTNGVLDIARRILGADHEANLSRGVGWDGSVGVLGNGEDFLAILLQLGDEGEVKPLVLSYNEVSASRSKQWR